MPEPRPAPAPATHPARRFAIVGFDLDGTLVDSAPDLACAVNHALAQEGRPPLDEAQVRTMVGGGARRLLAHALAASGGPVPDRRADALFDALLAYYGANIAVHTRPYDGAVEALQALAAGGVALGIATNKPEALARSLLDALGMAELFACVIGGDTLLEDRKKPRPDMLHAMAQGCGGGASAFVGDSRFDTAAARAAGMPCVAVSFGYRDGPASALGADAVIDRFADLAPTLARL